MSTRTTVEKKLPAAQSKALLQVLEERFEKNKTRHPQLAWATVIKRLQEQPGKLWSLQEMERTGGEPDVVRYDQKTGVITFFDCAAESPAGRRSICYDPQALASRKANKPAHSAVGMAAEMGVQLLSEAQYRALQQLGAIDTKTSSWIHTPDAIRKLGGALFCDRRFDTVFTYHNGAESYYAGRGFRAALELPAT